MMAVISTYFYFSDFFEIKKQNQMLLFKISLNNELFIIMTSFKSKCLTLTSFLKKNNVN